MTPLALIVSYRLGGTDGVSIEAAKWSGALKRLGFTVARLAGEIHGPTQPRDRVLPWLSASESGAPHAPELDAALTGADLIVVENVCSLPLNEPAATTVAKVLEHRGAPVVLHHHDLPWQRPHLGDIGDFPPRLPGALHVTINDLSRRELAARGVDAVTIRNAFDVDAPPGDRNRTRRSRGFAGDDVVVLQPARAIPRKNVPAGLEFAEAIADRLRDRRVHYWLTGPPEDGYGTELARILSSARVAVSQGVGPTPADAYAAADVVVFPSTWEGFGNPVVESVIARRPLAVAHYPVLDELLELGFSFFDVADPDRVTTWLRDPDCSPLDANLAIARVHCSLTALPSRIASALGAAGFGLP